MLIVVEEKREREQRDLERNRREREKQEKEARDRERRRQQAQCFRSNDKEYPRWNDPYGTPPQPNPKNRRPAPTPIPWDVMFRVGEVNLRRKVGERGPGLAKN